MSTASTDQGSRAAGRGWAVGILLFASVMLVCGGILQVLQGLAAIFEDELYVVGVDYSYEIDLTTWGWAHLVLGVIALVVGFGLAARQVWAYAGALIFAVLSIFANFAFMPYYPLWALLIIAIDILVIWAVCTALARD